MLECEMFLFTYPGKDGECRNQLDKSFNLTVRADLQQIRLIYMQQLTLRLVDYMFVQVLWLLNKKSVQPNEASD
jgi:hypothetical protein